MYIYILGRPHCGSTLLGTLLGDSPDVASAGELVHVRNAEGMCSCGATITACPFWRRVRGILQQQHIGWNEATQAAYSQAHVRRFLHTWLAPTNDPDLCHLARFTQALARAICEIRNKPHLLDSTKEVTRALFLAKYIPETHIIHLVRDPRDSVSSHYWRWKDHGYFFFLRRKRRMRLFGPLFMMLAAANWSVGNLLAELVTRRMGARTIRVRYEDLCRDPAKELTRISMRFGIDVGPVIERIRIGCPFVAEHNVGGNQVRFERALQFDPDRQRQRRPLPLWLRGLVVVSCWPLMLRYRYPLRTTRMHCAAAKNSPQDPPSPAKAANRLPEG